MIMILNFFAAYSLYTSHNLVVSVYVLWTHGWAVQKRMIRSISLLKADLCGSKEPQRPHLSVNPRLGQRNLVLEWKNKIGSRSPTERNNCTGFHQGSNPDRPRCKGGCNYKSVCAAAMRPFAKLLQALVNFFVSPHWRPIIEINFCVFVKECAVWQWRQAWRCFHIFC